AFTNRLPLPRGKGAGGLGPCPTTKIRDRASFPTLVQLRPAVGAELGVGQVLGLAVGAGLGGLAGSALRAELGVGRYLGVAVPAGERGGRRRGGLARLGRGGLGGRTLALRLLVAAQALGDDLGHPG